MRSVRWAISGFALLLSPAISAAPSVTLVAPATGTRYVAPTTIQLVADPSVDAGRSVARVEFLADGNIVGVATQPPYMFSWTDVPSGNYALRARVLDSRGSRDASPVVHVRVRDNVAPHIRILTPENKDTFAAPANIAVSLKATDRNDNLTSVTLFANGTQLAAFSAAPYEFNWTNVPPGIYALTAHATDDLGLTTTSRTKTITVAGSQPNLPPTVSLTAPSSDASFTAPASITLSATAADADGTISKVEFFFGSTLIGTSTEAPYSVAWTDVPQGTYALTALATDNAGAAVSSTAVNIMVARAEPKLYFIEVDHLNTPRAIYDDQQQLRWTWERTEPFGDSLPDENPSGVGALEFPGGFPGQYADKETGMRYATFRDCYDPRTGRFCQSDPIGLLGGINTYAYVGADPVRSTDILGLATYMCTRRLHNVPLRFGALYHQYVCVGKQGGGFRCGGLSPTGSMFNSPGKIESDTMQSGSCQLVLNDSDCVEDCIRDTFTNRLPNYSVDLSAGENCQTYANAAVADCVTRCKVKSK